MTISADNVRVAWPLFQTDSGGSIPTSALQLTLYRIPMRQAADLNYAWHSILPETYYGNLVGQPESVAYGAEFDGRWYAAAIWTTPIAANRLTDGWNCLELRRFAIAPDSPKNTASRCLSVMARLIRSSLPTIKRLISYQAVQFHAGTIYKAAGWSVAAHCESVPWDTSKVGRNRPEAQIDSEKVRWEKRLK